MRPLLRIALLLLAGAVSVQAIRVWAYQPCVCNAAITDLTGRTDLTFATSGDYDRMQRARSALSDLSAWRERCPEDVRSYMLSGANEEALGRYEDALRSYSNALRVERRPEVYMAMGNALIMLGRPAAAAESYSIAVRFDPRLLETIPSEEVSRLVAARLRGGA